MKIIVKLGEAKRTPSPPCLLVVKETLSNSLGLLEFPLSLHDGISEPQKSCKGWNKDVFIFEEGPGGSKENRYTLKIFSIEIVSYDP